MQSLKLSLWTVMIVFVALSLRVLAEDRTWTDREGKFQIEAMLLDFDGTDVKLKRKDDGKTLSIALEKLSLPDQAYVKKTMTELGGGAADKSENPFQEVDDTVPKPEKPVPRAPLPPKKSATTDDDEEATAEASAGPHGAFRGQVPVTRLSSAPAIRPERASASWSAEPDPAKFRKIDFRPYVQGFVYGKLDVGAHPAIEGIAFGDDAPEKILTALSINTGRDSKATKVFVGDLKTGVVRSQTYPAHLKVLGLSPDGTQALFMQKTGKSAFDFTHLTVADTTQAKLPCVGVLFPFAEKGDRSSMNTRISSADWIDNEHILVRGGQGILALIQAKNGYALWALDGSSAGGMVFSHGKKYVIATAKNNNHYLLETKTGRPIGLLRPAQEYKLGALTKFAFSLNGELIAAYDGGLVHLWEMRNGRAKEPFFVGFGIGGGKQELRWADDVHLLCGGTLIETVEQIPIWNYSDVHESDVFFAGRLWHASRANFINTSFYIADAEVPHPGMPKLPELSETQKFCVRPGLEIRLTVDSAIPDSTRLREHVAKNLAANGLKVVSGAPITLAVRMQTEAPQEGEWATRFGLGDRVGKATYTPYRYSFSVEQGGKTLWTISQRSGSPSVALSDLAGNRSLQDVVAEKSKPKSDWYFGVNIPRRIPFDKAGTSTLFRDR